MDGNAMVFLNAVAPPGSRPAALRAEWLSVGEATPRPRALVALDQRSAGLRTITRMLWRVQNCVPGPAVTGAHGGRQGAAQACTLTLTLTPREAA